jgi:spore coat protein U-like protein
MEQHMSSPILRALGVTAALLALGLSVGPAPALASGAATANLNLTASVAQDCVIGTATLGFGSYDPVVTNKTANLDQSTTMTVTCTKGAAGITMGLGPSGNAGTPCGASPARCLASGGNLLNYQLYSDSPGGAVWTTAITEAVAGGVGSPTTVTIYGRVPAGQDATVGASYTDTVVATVNY